MNRINLFSFSRSNASDDGVIFIEKDGCHTSEHLLEMFLQAGYILAVADYLQQVLVTHKVEPGIKLVSVSPKCIMYYE